MGRLQRCVQDTAIDLSRARERNDWLEAALQKAHKQREEDFNTIEKVINRIVAQSPTQSPWPY